jgi:uncharacterized repeat protein (TIGR03803 family)
MSRKHFARFIFAALMGAAVVAGAVSAQAQTFNVVANMPSGGGLNNVGTTRIVQGRNGHIYSGNGTQGNGVLFSVTTGGVIDTVYDVNDYPGSFASLGTDGNLYGGAWNADGGCGQLYKITPGGTETVLYSFPSAGTDGCNPNFAPVQAASGVFYGTTNSSSNGNGVVYSITAGGTFNVLHAFVGTDGTDPEGVVVGSDGNLYGGTYGGGANGDGVLFKITPSGTYTLLYNFCSQSNCSDGGRAAGALALANDGNLYGATIGGGAYGTGTIFRLTNSGVYTVINGGVDENPTGASLILGTDGNLYGIFSAGGSGNNGVIYSVTTSGVVTILHQFCQDTNCTDGYGPSTPLVQHTDGLFYGFTVQGGTANQCNSGLGCGVFYSLDMGLAAFVRLQSTSGKESTKVGILGQGFSASSVVSFGGTAATTVARAGSIFLSATVPAGALTGAVTVTTGATTLTSSQTFDVIPTFTTFSPTSGPVGTPVTLTGTALTQTTKVTFNGKSATFTVNSDTQVTATVPTGATTGKIGIATKGGKAESSTSFTVN